MSRIYWDSMLFIYWMEDHPVFANRVSEIYSRMQGRQDQLITATFTFGEVLAGAYRRNATRLADELRPLLRKITTEIVPFTMEAAERYAYIRGALAIAPADAIHLACAAESGTDLFLTNDKRLVGKTVPGIHFIASLDAQLF